MEEEKEPIPLFNDNETEGNVKLPVYSQSESNESKKSSWKDVSGKK